MKEFYIIVGFYMCALLLTSFYKIIEAQELKKKLGLNFLTRSALEKASRGYE